MSKICRTCGRKIPEQHKDVLGVMECGMTLVEDVKTTAKKRKTVDGKRKMVEVTEIVSKSSESNSPYGRTKSNNLRWQLPTLS
jgi:hypothetical protein